jgi:hypothetical protein
MEALRIPLRVLWMDRARAKGAADRDDSEWDRERRPDAEGIIR